MVQDFCFWAVWAAGPVHKKKLGADYEQLLRAGFSCFQWQNELENRLSVQGKGQLFSKGNFGVFKFSNLSVLHKGLLMQDWVFRLGSYLILQRSSYILLRTTLFINNLNKTKGYPKIYKS